MLAKDVRSVRGEMFQKPYELDIRMYNANPGANRDEIACVKAQIHII